MEAVPQMRTQVRTSSPAHPKEWMSRAATGSIARAKRCTPSSPGSRWRSIVFPPVSPARPLRRCPPTPSCTAWASGLTISAAIVRRSSRARCRGFPRSRSPPTRFFPQ
jgi:hypothetical protein